MDFKYIIDKNTPIVFSEKKSPEAVSLAMRDLGNDWYRVLGMEPIILDELPDDYCGNAILIGSAAEGFAQKPSERESFSVKLSGKCLCLTGADELGEVYAIYNFSKSVLGVDPWYYWNDITPDRKEKIELDANFELSHGAPTFKYRGFFINNEDMLTGSFYDPTYQNMMSPYHFDKICELILRLNGNIIAPGTRIFPDEPIRDIASRRGLYVNDHHVTPLGLNVYKWPEELPFSYVTHPEILEEMWAKCVDAQKHRKMLWTVSFRGKGDGPFWNVDPAAPVGEAERADIINRAVAKQVELIRNAQPDADIIFNMYFEQAELYKKGLLKIPEGVIKVWPNNGAGTMADNGMASDGDGAYFHITACRNRTSEAVSPAKAFGELGRFAKNGATGCLVMNVGNIRSFPISISAVMDVVYDSKLYTAASPDEEMDKYIEAYASRTYGEYTKKAAEIYQKFFRCSNFRMPREDMAPFGYGGECLGMYASDWRADFDPVLPEFRQSLYMHELARKFIRVLSDGEEFSEIWEKTVDDFNAILEEDTAYLPSLLEDANALYANVSEKAKKLCNTNMVAQIRTINSANIAMYNEGLSIKAYMAGDKEKARAYMQKAFDYVEDVFEAFHTTEDDKWSQWFKYECLACYFHTYDLIRCVLSLFDGNGKTLVRPFIDFGGHGYRVSIYQYRTEKNPNYPLLGRVQ